MKFKKHRHSFNDLNMLIETISGALVPKYTISYISISAKTNKCTIEYVSDDLFDLTRSVEQVISENNDLKNFSIDDIVFKKWLYTQPESNIYSGMAASCTAGTSTTCFTVRMCGSITTSSGLTYNGIVTCGHGQALSSSVKVNGANFGVTCLMQYAHNAYGDYACIRRTSSDTFPNSATADPLIYCITAITYFRPSKNR
ncbi:MAG: hypothetical protein J6F31_01830 [Oscillospiraceae bacterium]|nr:hypothetical protein [Ruminococcus sp.]MBQ5329971.1 hypothetical protein [Oscillospiraceae bacterium]